MQLGQIREDEVFGDESQRLSRKKIKEGLVFRCKINPAYASLTLAQGDAYKVTKKVILCA